MPYPKPIQDQLDDLAMYPDRAERIEMLVAIGGEYRHEAAAEVPREVATRVPGCESEVFIDTIRSAGGGLGYRIAVDNPQGISAMALAVVLQSLNGLPASEAASLDEGLVFEMFGRELSMGKSLGLTGMVRMVKTLAQRSQ